MNKKDLKLFIKIPILSSTRLTLRKIRESDLEDVFEYASDPEVSEYLLWYPHPTKSFTKKYLALVESKYKKAEFYDWAIIYNGKMIGTCGFTSLSVENNSGEIGYVLAREFWGREIAQEAARRVIKFGFEELGLNRIEAKYMIENEQSKRTLEKCGMTHEGVLRQAIFAKEKYRDIGIYSITADEYFSCKATGKF